MQIVLVMTLLSVAPSIVLLMTRFTRIVIVLGFVRTALGTPSAPSNQIVVGLSLFLTFFLMGPVFDRVHKEALTPYLDGKITVTQALDQATGPLKEFMLKQTRTRDLEYFLELGGFGPTAVKDLPMRVVIPAFVISELQTAFQMGFLLFPAVSRHRFSRLLRADGTRHDDDAAGDNCAAAEAPPLRPGGRLAPGREVARAEFRQLINTVDLTPS